MQGKVKWFDAKKGFGFIVTDGVQGDIFLHYSKIDMTGYKSVEENQEVTFNLKEVNGKPTAENVVPTPMATE